MRNPFDNIDMKAFISQFSSDFINEQNKQMLDKTDEDYIHFGKCLKDGKCYLCGRNIEDISGEPCLHWIINEQIKKKKLKLLLNSNIGFFRVYSYLVCDAHIIFTNEDLFKFSMIRQGIMTFDPGYGAGLEALKEDDLQRSLPEWLSQSKDEETAQFRTQTIINTNLPRAILDELFEMHKESGMVMPAIIDKLNKEKGYNIEYYTRTIPNSFPEMNHRTQRGESKRI